MTTEQLTRKTKELIQKSEKLLLNECLASVSRCPYS